MFLMSRTIFKIIQLFLNLQNSTNNKQIKLTGKDSVVKDYLITPAVYLQERYTASKSIQSINSSIEFLTAYPSHPFIAANSLSIW
jgi:hypothetical protein